MKKTLFIILSVIMLGLAGCSTAISSDVLQSEESRVTSPAVAQDEMTDLVDGNSAFAINLYQALKDTGGNLFYSPLSISEAMAMTYGGARSDTEKQMADVLCFALSQDRLHPAFNSLEQELARRGQGAEGQDEEGFRLNVVNAIWGQDGFSFSQQYLDLLAQNYGSGIRILDFKKATEPSRNTINQWVSDQTEGKIKDLIPQGAISTLTRMVLTNAVYFNSAWQYPFQEEATSDGTFHLLDGNVVAVPMMKQIASYGYAQKDNYQAVELPYDGRELSMIILLPELEHFGAFETSLDSRQLNNIIQNIKYQQVALSMPRFTFESSFGLKKALRDLGMPLAFSDKADFSGMDGDKDLFLSDVLHKAFISVDEAGTEAAAATAVIAGITAVQENPVAVTVDHPFIFLIRDIETGTILFIGRMVNPEI